MTKLCRVATASCVAALVVAGGCGEGDGQDQVGPPPPELLEECPAGADRLSPGIKQIMIKLDGRTAFADPCHRQRAEPGPAALGDDPGSDEGIRTVGRRLGQVDPRKGAKESWNTLRKGLRGPGRRARPGGLGQEQRGGQGRPRSAQELV